MTMRLRAGLYGAGVLGIAPATILAALMACSHSSAESGLAATSVAVGAAPGKQTASKYPSREITFTGVGNFTLKGTLLLPSTGGKFPAALLLPGSGPTDRDGNQQPAVITDVLKQIAEKLAENGIASLRFDKRAVARVYLSEYPKPDKYNEFFSWDAQAGDAKAALEFLRKQPEIDAARVAAIGHSEGCMFSEELGALPDAPKTLVLIGAPGRVLKDILRNQIVDGLRRGAVADDQQKKIMSDYDRVIVAIEKTGKVPTDITEVLKPLFPAYATDYLKTFTTYNPAKKAESVKCPVLIVQGEKDIQISATADTPVLLKALQARKGIAAEAFIVPGASHCLKAVTNVDTEPGFSGPIVPSALTKIVDWLKKQL